MLTLSIAVNCLSQSSGAVILWQLSSVQRIGLQLYLDCQHLQDKIWLHVCVENL